MLPPLVLNVDAIDTRGEEGVLADARVFEELQCATVHVTTAVLVSDQRRVAALERMSDSIVGAQFEAAWSNGTPTAGRIGLLRDSDQIEWIAELMIRHPVPNLVLAPVLRHAGAELCDAEGLAAIRKQLFPLARVVAIRVGDVAAMTGETVDDLDKMKRASARLRDQGARAVLVSGLIRQRRVLDLLDDEGRFGVFDATRVTAPRVGGLSGAYSAALAAGLAGGSSLARAVGAAQRYVGSRLQRGR